MQDVTITIYQNNVLITTLTTDTIGDANTTLNAGNYTINFAYPNRLPSSTDISLTYDNTMLIFAFPNSQVTSAKIFATPVFSQIIGFMMGVSTYPITPTAPTVTSTPVFTNT